AVGHGVVWDGVLGRGTREKNLKLWEGPGGIFNRSLKLRTHLIVLVLAALLPVLIFTFEMFRQKAQLQHEAVERGMRDTVRALSLAGDRGIGAGRAILGALAE